MAQYNFKLKDFKGFSSQLAGDKVMEIIADNAEKLAQSINSAAQTDFGTHTGYTYAKGFTAMQKSRTEYVVGNRGEHASLAHLLEFGHETRSSNFWHGTAHIEPAYEVAKEQIKKDLREANWASITIQR
ncbi:MAG: hypothetical protein LBH89_02405 [Lactococcus lactis]|nr:hypothetical protein [Lactococcus lactis]